MAEPARGAIAQNATPAALAVFNRYCIWRLVDASLGKMKRAVHLPGGTRPCLHANMNDLEFAHRVTPRIGEMYAEAKRSRRLFPAHTLTQTRGIANLFCEILRDETVSDWPVGLERKIGTLVNARRINNETRRLLQQLRRWGNTGAHPEESLLDETQIADRAASALEATRELLEIGFRQKHRGAVVPTYDIVDDDVEDLKDVCYRALVENCAADQYQVAMLLRRQLAAEVAAANAAEDPELILFQKKFELDALDERSLDLLRYGSNSGHAAARYMYGLALTEGRLGKDKVAYGASLIARACNDGDADAQVWCGHAALYGEHDEPVDYERARTLLELAATEDQPLALSLLSTIHRQGLGVPANPRLAFELTLRAAQAGYPNAQYEAAAALFDGIGTERDQQAAFLWLQRASEGGVLEAKLAQARLVRNGSLPGGSVEAERLLLAATQRINEARFELAGLYMEQSDPRKWLAAANLVQAAYEQALSEQDVALAERCRSASPDWIKKLSRLTANGRISGLSDQDLSGLVQTRFLFDEYGRPYPNRRDRALLFRDNVLGVVSENGK